jgi:hypothetical protein
MRYQRLSARLRGYDSRWDKARLTFLRRHPLCAMCLVQGHLEQATVVDQFDRPTRYDVVNPTRLCTPADKNGESPGAADHPEHLLCYGVKPAKGQPKHVKVLNLHVNNQFGPERLDTINAEELCVPSTKTLPE